ncbi:alpha/beta hydrolase family protein [Mammaliicoccus sciuri]|uniref:alpha/beta hydrolase family protein n=1 Tax=Mammaliicoccus sciuri TaxID=1296 RepID=UPI0034DD5D5B
MKNNKLEICIRNNEYIFYDNDVLSYKKNGIVKIISKKINNYIGLYNEKVYFSKVNKIFSISLVDYTVTLEYKLPGYLQSGIMENFIIVSSYNQLSYSIYSININNNSMKKLYSSGKIHSFFIQQNYIVLKVPYFKNKYTIMDIKGKIIKIINEHKLYLIPHDTKEISYDISFIENNFKTSIKLDDKTLNILGRLTSYIILNSKLYLLSNDISRSYIYMIDLNTVEVSIIKQSHLNFSEIFLFEDNIYYNISDISNEILITNILLDEDIEYEFNIKNEIINKRSMINKCYYTIYKNLSLDKLKGIYFYVHGGPKDYIGKNYDQLKSLFINSGYLLVAINYHGSITYGMEYEESIYGKWGFQELRDIKEVIEEVISEYPNLKKDIRMLGISYGGILANLIVVKENIELNKVVSISSPYEVKKFYDNLPRFYKNIFNRRALYKGITKYNIEEFNPINYVKNKENRTYLIYIYGDKDKKIPMNSNIEREIKKNVNSYIQVRTAGHNIKEIFDNQSNIDDFLNLIFK